MKWSKQWVAAAMLLPAIYLAGCGSGTNEADREDTISTQSPPPVDTNTSLDTTNSSIRGGGTDEPGSAATGSTSATGSTGSESGNTGLSSSDKSVATPDNTKTSSTKTTTSKTYNRSSTASARKSTSTKKTTAADADAEAEIARARQHLSKDVTRMADTASTGVSELADTTANKVGELSDTAASKMGRITDSTSQIASQITDTTATSVKTWADTADHQLHHQGDSSTINRDNTISADSANTSMVNDRRDSTDLTMADSSRRISTADTGINFSSSVFIPEQIKGNYAEIKLARMAIDKSQNEDVKQVARTLENDHNALLRELQDMMNKSGTGSESIPTSENEMARQHMDMMKNLTGQEFDRQWIQHMHMMHDQKVQMFEQAETNNSIQDAELRIWVNKTLPTLRKHRDMLAQTLNSLNR